MYQLPISCKDARTPWPGLRPKAKSRQLSASAVITLNAKQYEEEVQCKGSEQQTDPSPIHPWVTIVREPSQNRRAKSWEREKSGRGSKTLAGNAR